jgi:phosphoglycolate phosphatase
MERTRILKLFLDDLGLPKAGDRVLHLAPEAALAPALKAAAGGGYDPADFDPAQYKRVGARKLDLVTDAEALPGKHYDLIIHSHVMEHVPANMTAILWHLHRSLKDDGLHLFCIPMLKGRFAEDFGPMTAEEATKRFGQGDHVRRFCAADLKRTLGMIFRLPETYDIAVRFGRDRLLSHGIMEYAWRGFTSHTIFELRKGDLKLA